MIAPIVDDARINFARYYATTKHAGQFYGGSLPYTHHLAAVEEKVRWWWLREGREVADRLRATPPPPGVPYLDIYLYDVLTAAWLHDIMEDCGVKRKEIEDLFGPAVADLVWRVTNEPGENRKARHLLTYPKIAGHPLAVFLKLCDRLANVGHSRGNSRMLAMYAKEQAEFEQALHTPGEFDIMWQELNALLKESA